MKKSDINNKYVLLEEIKLPEELKNLSASQLNNLCGQIRNVLIDSVSKTGGHLASNLGAVELTVALHSVFDTPKDKIVWDVGHQSYTHKILTGRLEKLSTLRQEGRISGFPKPKESEYDSFISGHSSTSISAALGIAVAMKKNGDNHHTIAVIGDGAFTGGLAYEGLNNAGKSDTNIIIILNYNEMSISKNVGALSKYLSTMRTKQSYLKTKNIIEKTLDRTPILGKPIKTAIKSSKTVIKNMLLHSTMFEDFGFAFIGPVDGHNISELQEALQSAKAMNKPAFIHVNTIKGKGYAPAEENSGEYHSIGKFEIATGNPDVVSADSYSSEWGKELSRLADSDARICAVTAAMKYGTGLQYFTETHKDKFFDVGIAEQHAVTFSAGLSKMGMLPVFSVYSSFLQRSYDQLIHDVSIDNTHLVLGIDRAGIVGEDGETHQGLFDVTMLTTIPNVTLYSPSCYEEMRMCLNQALYKDTGIVGVRYPRGSDNSTYEKTNLNIDYTYINNNSETLLITYGRIYNNLLSAAETLKEKARKCDVLKLTRIFPISEEIFQISKTYKHIFFFEESMKNGSISDKFSVKLFSEGYKGSLFTRAVEGFVQQATVSASLKKAGLDSESMVETVLQEIN